MEKIEKFHLQASQYAEPYHHFVSFDDLSIYKSLPWGLEYYAYVRLVVEAVRHYRPHTVAEVGCGDGKVLYEAAKNADRSVRFDGYDPAGQAIAFARAYAHALPNLHFYEETFSGARTTYDMILCIETLEHISDTDSPDFVRSLHTHLADDGLVVVTIPTTNRPIQEKHYRHYTPDILAEQIGEYFSIEKAEYVCADTWASTALRKLLANRFYILSYQPLRKHLFALYMKRYARASPNTGTHLLAVLRKNGRTHTG